MLYHVFRGEWTWKFDASCDHTIHLLPTDAKLTPGGEYFISVTGKSQLNNNTDKSNGRPPQKSLSLALSFRIGAVHVRPIEIAPGQAIDDAAATKAAAAVLSVDGTDVTQAGTTIGVRMQALEGLKELEHKLARAKKESGRAAKHAKKAEQKSKQAEVQRKRDEQGKARLQEQQVAEEKERKKEERELAKAEAEAKKKRDNQRRDAAMEAKMAADSSSSSSASLGAGSQGENPESEAGSGNSGGEVDSLASIPSTGGNPTTATTAANNAYTLPNFVYKAGEDMPRKPGAYDSRRDGKWESSVKARSYFDAPVNMKDCFRSSTGTYGPASVRLRKDEMVTCLNPGGSALNQRGTEALYVSEPYHNVDARCDRLAARLRPRYRIKECLPAPQRHSGRKGGSGSNSGSNSNNNNNNSTSKENAGNSNMTHRPRRPSSSSNGSGSVRQRLLKQVEALTNQPAPIVELGGVQLETPLPGTANRNRTATSNTSRSGSDAYAYGQGYGLSTSTHAGRMSAQRIRIAKEKAAAAQRLQNAREALLHIELAGFDEERMHKERQSACLIGPSSLGGLRNLSCSTKTANRGHVRFGSSTSHR